MTRASAIALGWIVPHPELGRAYKAARFADNPRVGPCVELPWWADEPTLRMDDAARLEAAKAVSMERMWTRKAAA